jgi:Zn-dependent alcohol dehydrogenase
MTKAIVTRTTGGPEVLKLETVEVGEPDVGQARIRQTTAGVNLHDVYVRTELYQTLKLPGIPGLEAIGVAHAPLLCTSDPTTLKGTLLALASRAECGLCSHDSLPRGA